MHASWMRLTLGSDRKETNSPDGHASCPSSSAELRYTSSSSSSENVTWKVTSKAYVKDVAVPYFKKKIEALREADASQCKPFGEQVCILVIDCWYG